MPKLIYDFNHVSTDDACIDGTIVPISPQVAGKVVKVCVKRNQFVRKGQILFEIDKTDYIQQVKNTQNIYQANQIQLENLKLSIFLKANLEYRAKNISKEFNMDRDQAIELIKKTEPTLAMQNLLPNGL
ncbi:MAG TPA: biotin/lipoyl-binding protein [Desulfurella acetivorans]|uniref:Biotin/lipoyl-binding protein n=1 Tax=Desulfurella acetivorans TaxID=33002 RepID=A0A7C6E7R9_DESAE|nr:biotin/lipoyl-binding protein [Desulfurella acetivorans]